MKTLFFECNMGAAGDMLMSALLELHENPNDFLKKLNRIMAPKVTIAAEKSIKCGISGTHTTVKVNGKEEKSHDVSDHDNHHAHNHNHNHDHSDHNHGDHRHDHSEHDNSNHEHNNYDNIKQLISNLEVSDFVKQNALNIYKLIAEAESAVHDAPVTQVHFHEVGQLDALTDIVGVCLLIEHLNPKKIISSPINVGSGHVKCSHGILPIPAPATALILKGAPFYSDQLVKGELCTPTGAAILMHFASTFSNLPLMVVSAIGYGMGKKDFVKANCIRVFIGESETQNSNEEIIELVCNIDDMAAEGIAYAQQALFEAGALDVYTYPIGMKKSRTGTSFTCMCNPADKDKMISLIFKHTSTLGIREYASKRHFLHREHLEVKTKFGNVRLKKSFGFGVEKFKPEYDDVAKIAKKTGLSIQEVLDEVKENTF